MSRVVLLDGDTFVYAAASASEYETQWNEWLWTLHADLDEGMTKLEELMRPVLENLKPDRIVVALSDEKRFRPLVLPTYKSNRKGQRKPIIYQALREYMLEAYDAVMKPWLEGDDVLGVLATHKNLLPETDKIVVSIDKDLQTIPGQHVNYQRDPALINVVTEEDADRFFMKQVLTGDSTDGYKGLPGCGPVKADKILEGMSDIGEMWPAVVKAYAKAGLSEEVALQQARVARILRAEDYDYKLQKPILWTP